MTGMRRKRSLGQNLPDTASAAINVPRKVGASAHGGLEYHRYSPLGLCQIASYSQVAIGVCVMHSVQAEITPICTAIGSASATVPMSVHES